MSYQRFNRADDIIENQKTTITSGMWTGGSTRLTSNFCTSSTQGASSASYIDSYQTASTSADAEVQFAVGYANIDGKGSIGNTSDTNDGNRETKAMYSQFLNLLTAPNTSNITFAGTGGSTSSGSISQGGRVYNVVSGSIDGGTSIKKEASAETVSGGAGLFYPDLGLILLNPNYVSESAGASLIPARSTNTFYNIKKTIFTAISTGAYYQARREEEIISTSYFCRVNNKRFNI